MSLSFDGGCGEYAASDQNIDFEVIESNRFENMVERISASGSAYNDDSDGKTSAQIEPHQVSKGNGICFILFFVIVLKISRDLPVLDMYTDI